MSSLSNQISEKARLVEGFLENHFASLKFPAHPGVHELVKSMKYSSLGGGKRFRPVLSLLVADLLQKDAETVLPFASAVEMIHTYSLIHDDLPCMDDDKERRGQPTNHIVFGESTALLAGDTLLTEAFHLIAAKSTASPAITLESIRLLAEAAGVAGMTGGQAIDLSTVGKTSNREELEMLHATKTGALIRVSAEGAAAICGASEKQRQELRQYGTLLGLAFQLQDDLHDHDPKNPEPCSFTSILGYEKTKTYLLEVTEKAIQIASRLGGPEHPLVQLAHFNSTRAV